MSTCSRVCLILMLCVLVWCEEHIHHGRRVPHSEAEGEHDEDFDHKAILGSEDLDDEYEGLPPEIAKQRLEKLVKENDLNSDGSIDKGELTKWIAKSFEKLDREEAVEKFAEEDEDKDGKVSWKEYLNKIYTYSPEDVEKMRIKAQSEGHKTVDGQDEEGSLKMVDDDKRFFDAADLNGDGHLEMEEYLPFYFPPNYEHMHKMEIERYFTESDANKDGKLSPAEFMPEHAASDKESQISTDENFKDLDKDNDGFLSPEEVKEWVVPGVDAMVEDEVNHLIEMADTKGDNLKGDGVLTMEEILDKTSQFVGSSITDYGNFLKHDEL